MNHNFKPEETQKCSNVVSLAQDFPSCPLLSEVKNINGTKMSIFQATSREKKLLKAFHVVDFVKF